jgi:copper transporter 1
MDMFFQWNTSVTVLFEVWVTPTWYYYLLSCFAVLALAFGLEGMRLLIHNLTHRAPSKGRKSFVRRLGETMLYGVYMCMSYFVMLVVMTYNVGLFVSVLLGLCLGHFLFRRDQSTSQDNVALINTSETESCH